MDSPTLEYLDFRRYCRRYGVEIEVNATDGRSRPTGESLPEGIHYVGLLVQRAVGGPVVINKWHHTHHNDAWVIKPDSSCGMEICSPVSKGTTGLREICKVVEAVRDDVNVDADERCSLHLHVEVADMNPKELAAVLAYWVKCEYVFFCSVPSCRKRNRYCQQVGLTDLFEHDTSYSPYQLINKLSEYKYYSLNTYHYNKGKRPTIEFRICESEACKDPHIVTNWIRLVLHFVEMTRQLAVPPTYQPGDAWSSYLWLNPTDVFRVLGFLPGQSNLSPEMEETREWFVRRLLVNTPDTKLPGIWADAVVGVANAEVRSLAADLHIFA